MVLSYLIALFLLFSVLFGAICGKQAAVSAAMLEGAADALTLGISIAGPVCLWSALQNVMEQTGISRAIAAFLRPLLSFLFPDSFQDAAAASAISQNFSANLLGLGNAATPMGIRAICRMRERSGSAKATDEMCRFIVLNTASIQLIPATVAAARASLGSAEPYRILPAVWCSSLVSVSVGLCCAKLLERWTR